MAAPKAATLIDREPHPDWRYHKRHCKQLFQRLFLVQLAQDLATQIALLTGRIATLPSDPETHFPLSPVALRAIRAEIVEAFHHLQQLDHTVDFLLQLEPETEPPAQLDIEDL